MTDSEPSGGLDTRSRYDRAEGVTKARLAGCMLTRKRLLATCRSSVSAFRIIHYHGHSHLYGIVVKENSPEGLQG